MVDEVVARRALCSNLFETGRGNNEPGIRGSLWAAYNGVTDWADHRMRYKSRFQRFNSLFFGESAAAKRRALSGALKLLGNVKTAAAVETAGLN